MNSSASSASPTRSRRTFASVAATTASAAALGLAAVVAAPQQASAALPEVSMERVVLAASLDPHRPTTGATTVGAKDDVLLVEQALRAKGLLDAGLVDGSFGSSTTTAWKTWENRFHATSTAWTNNGLPGLAELRELGEGRFTVVQPIQVGAWVTEDAETIDARTEAMFHKAEQLSGTNMVITQGRGNGSLSAGTHLGGGVIDIRVRDNPGATSARVNALKQVGFAAWYREDGDNSHIHAVAINDPFIAHEAHFKLCQIYQWRFGGSAFSCSSSLAGADREIVTWEDWQRAH